MTTGEPKTQMHAGSAWQLLLAAEADHTLMTHDLPLKRTGENWLWHATLHAVKRALQKILDPKVWNTPATIMSGCPAVL